MLKSYKYRIYPNKAQQAKIDHSISVCRLVYNLALETKIYAYKTQRINLSAFDLCYQLVDLKKEYPWIAEVDSQALQASVKKIETAFNGFFRGGGYPNFKSKYSKQGFQCPNAPKRIDWVTSTLTIPKIKGIRIALSRKFFGQIKTVSISKTASGKYFASILVDNSEILSLPKTISESETVGIDTGIKSLVIVSNGKVLEANRSLKDNLKRLKCLQRRASRKKKGSENRKKANKKVGVLHEQIINKRTDYIHKATHALTHDNQVTSICIEDLNVKGMVKNHKLAQALSDVSLGEFYRQLEYKCKWYGVNLIKIGRFEPSSKLCSICGSKNDELKLSHREWECVSCGTLHDRDLNAAVNIKNIGLRNSGVGSAGEPVESSTIVGAVKQESIPTIKSWKSASII